MFDIECTNKYILLSTLRGGLSGANASATNWGPRAEPPIPIERIWVKVPFWGGLICVRNDVISD